MPARVSSLVLACAFCAVPGLTVAADTGAPAAAAPVAAQPTEAVVARVNGHVITARAFDEALRSGFRQKFYHGQPPEAEYRQFMKETALKMIDGFLLPDEAQRRGIAPDNAAVEAQLTQLEARYRGGSAEWAKRREQALPGLRKEFERQSIASRLEAQVKEVAQPSDAELQAYYNANPKLFTEPVRFRVSLIMLRVDPSSNEATWQSAVKGAAALREQILGGASFADMARRYSNDATADQGGDMGYVHDGQLGPEVQAHLVAAKPGSILEPIRTLDGVVLLRLDELHPPKLRTFAEAKERATALYLREASKTAWEKFVSNLRKSAKVELSPELREIVGTEFANP